MRIFSVNVDLMDIGDQKYILNTTQDITERKQAEEMLCQNEERFSSAFEYSSIGMALVAEDGRFLKVNNALRDIVGYSDQELLVKTFQDITHPDDMDADLALLHQLVVGEILTYKIEKRYFHKSGQVVWVLLSVSMIHDAQGKPLYFISQIQDINERKQAEIDIRKKSEQLQLLSTELEIIMDNIPALIFYKDTNNRFIRVNKYMSDAYKMSKKQLEGASLFDLHSSEQAQAYYDDDLQVIRSRQPKLNIDEPWETENGTRWTNTSKVPRINETGEVVGVIGISMDITERKQAEEALRESEEKFRNLFNNSEVGMFRTQLDGSEILDFNEKYLKILGYTIDEVKGKPSVDKWVDKNERDKMVVQLKTEGYVTDLECDLFNKQGEVRRCITSLRLYPEVGILEGSIQDVTERKRAAEELVLANKELLFQNDEKEKRAAELVLANKELALSE